MDGITALGSREIDILIVGGGTSGAALAGIIARDTDRQRRPPRSGAGLRAARGRALARRPARCPHLAPHARLGVSRPRAPDARECHRLRPGAGNRRLLGAQRLRRPARPPARLRPLGGTRQHRLGLGGLSRRRSSGRSAACASASWTSMKLTPFHAAFIDGAAAAGIPRVVDMNDPDDDQGVAASPVNIFDGMRWNTSLGYLDPVRDRPNLRIVGDVLVDRVEIARGRAVAVQAIIGGERVRIPAARIVLAAARTGRPPSSCAPASARRTTSARSASMPSIRSPVSGTDWWIIRRSNYTSRGRSDSTGRWRRSAPPTGSRMSSRWRRRAAVAARRHSTCTCTPSSRARSNAATGATASTSVPSCRARPGR